MESTAVDNVVFTGNNGILKYIRDCVYNRIFYYLPIDVYKLYIIRIHVRWKVHRSWEIQQLTTLCTLKTTEYLKYIRDCVYNSTFYFLPGDVYKLYNRRKHYRRRVHRRWSTAVDNVVYTGNNGIFEEHTRLRVRQYILFFSRRRVQAVQQKNTC